MGFFGDINRGLFGGTKSGGSNESQSGMALLPPELREAFTDYASKLPDAYSSGMLEQAYTPTPLTGIENKAIGNMEAGFTPTSETLGADMSMLSNPFDESVINEINRQAGGEYSILKQALGEAGQVGSNRAMLGASDVDERRLDQIGSFKQDQYNTALNQVLSNLVPQRQQDAAMQMGAGEVQRGVADATNQAPVSALSQYGKLLGAIPQSGGSRAVGENQSTGSTGAVTSISGFF